MKQRILGVLFLCASVGIGNGLSGCGIIMDTAVNRASDQATQGLPEES